MILRALNFLNKSFGALLLSLFITMAANASTKIDLKKLLLSNPTLLKIQLNSMLSRRCAVYTQEPSACRAAAKEAIELLDIHPILLSANGKTEKYIFNFKKNLDSFPTPEVMIFLDLLETKLLRLQEEIKFYGFIDPSLVSPLDIGSLAMNHFRNSELAWKVLATLFQDIDPSVTQIRYLDSKLGKSAELVKLYSVIKLISRITYTGKLKPIKLLGHSIPNVKIYHTLVPAYLSSQLKAKGYSKRVSFAVPFFLNYIYEIAEIQSTSKAYFLEPKTIEKRGAIEDIYSGELGALVGLGLVEQVQSEKEIQQKLKSSPMLYLTDLIRVRIQQ